MRGAAAVIGLLIVLFAPLASAQAASPFSRWNAVVVAGDFHAHSGGPTEAFDNARRDVSKTLVDLGFERTEIRQFSVRPDRYRAEAPGRADAETLRAALRTGGQAAGVAGCLFYISTHGSPEGVVLGKQLLRPQLLAAMLDDACGAQPTVVVISACFSGVFIPPLQKPNRLIITAARPDRASFGCGEDDKHPYFRWLLPVGRAQRPRLRGPRRRGPGLRGPPREGDRGRTRLRAAGVDRSGAPSPPAPLCVQTRQTDPP